MSPPPRRHRFAPRLHQLEARDTPAMTFTVTNLDDFTFGSLRAAIDMANVTPGDDTIVFQPGLTGTINVFGGYSITDNVAIVGPAAGGISVNGQFGEFSDPLFTNTAAVTSVSNLIVENGTVFAGPASPGGAGFYNVAGQLTLDNMTVRGNTVVGTQGFTGSGGGVFNGGTLNLINGTVVANNSAGSGGGVFNGGFLTLTNATIQNNTAGTGGGVLSAGAQTVTATDSSFLSNTATADVGGGLVVYGGSILALTRTTFRGNQATAANAAGGGLYVIGTATQIADSTFESNSASLVPGQEGTGGGLFVGDATTLTVNNTTFDQNLAGRGGAGYVAGTGNASLASLRGLTVTNNRATDAANGFGGAFFLSGVSTILDGTYTGNRAARDGGAVYANVRNLGVSGATFASNVAGANEGTGDGGGLFAYTDVDLFVTATTFDGNEATRGGGLVMGGSTSGSTPSQFLTFSTVRNNRTTADGFNGLGGGVIASNATILSSTIAGNTSDSGGGVYAGGAVTITDSTVSGNTANAGGGVFADDLSQLTINGNSQILTNTANVGGGVYVILNSTLTMTDVTVSGNTANTSAGGGVGIDGAASSATLTRVTVSGNTATLGSGGGVFTNSPNVSVADSTFSNNAASASAASPAAGGGLAATGATVLRVSNTSFTGNTAAAGGGVSFRGAGAKSTATLSGVTFLDNVAAVGDGGGLSAANASAVTLEGVAVNGNSAAGSGGGVFFDDEGAGGTLTVTASSATPAGFTQNRATQDGGAIRVTRGGLTLTGTRVASNSATNGGGVSFESSEALLATDAIVENNTASGRGGGLFVNGRIRMAGGAVRGNSSAGDGGGVWTASTTGTTFDAATFLRNVSSGGSGGGAFVASSAFFIRVLFRENGAAVAGGGLAVTGPTNLILSSSFEENAAGGPAVVGGTGRGGGLFVTSNQAAGGALIDSTTFLANQASGSGGGVFVDNGTGERAPGLTVTNSTFDGNRADEGGGIAAGTPSIPFRGIFSVTNVTITRNAALTAGGGLRVDGGLVNSLVALNTAPAGPDGRGSIGSGGGTLFGNTSGVNYFPGPGDVTNVDPKIGPIGDYGGPTLTVPLLAGSPAGGIGRAGAGIPAVDQRGVARPAGGPIDAGAYQVRPVTAVAPQAYSVAGNQTLTIPAPGLLAGATNPDAVTGPLTVILLSAPSPAGAGTLTANADGSFSFTPAAGFGGRATFTFAATNGVRTSPSTTATIDVTPVPPGPPVPPPPPNPPVPPVPPPPPVEVQRFAAGAGAGGGPRVKAFDTSGNLVFDAFAFDGAFSGGVRVAVGDVTGDGVEDVVAGAGPGGGPRVQVFDGVTGAVVRDFFAFEPTFANGVYVAAGDVTGDGRADVVVGAGSLGGPRVVVIDGATGQEVRSFFAYAEDFLGGVRVAVGDVNGDGVADIVTTPGPGGGPQVRGLDGRTGQELFSFFGVEETYQAGLFVAVGRSVGAGQPGVVVVGRDSFPDFEGSVFVELNNPSAGPPVLPADLVDADSLVGPAEVRVFGYDPASPGGVRVPPAGADAYPGFAGGVRVAARPAAGGFRVATAPGRDGGGRVRILELTAAGFAPVAEFQPFDPAFTGSIYVG